MNTPVETRTLFSLTYVSSAVRPFSSSQLVELLNTSRRNNTDAGLTGMLLYKDGNFMQVLEGPEETVRRVHGKILRDPRHCGMIVLLEHEIANRQFGDWSMGFRNLDDPQLTGTPGFSEFMNTALTSTQFRDNPSFAQKLLASFKKRM